MKINTKSNERKKLHCSEELQVVRARPPLKSYVGENVMRRVKVKRYDEMEKLSSSLRE
jgi:hypothetical protein